MTGPSSSDSSGGGARGTTRFWARTRFWPRTRFWLVAGAWLGVVDGVLSVAWTSHVAGSWLERILTVLVTMVVDAVAVALLAHLLALPAALLGRFTRASTEAWIRALILAALPFVPLLILLRERHPLGKSLPAILAAIAVSAVLALVLAALLVRWLRWLSSPYPTGGAYLRTLAAALVVALVVPLFLGPGDWGGRSGRAAAEGRPNVILISIDTLRADHLSAYGYERETTPHLDALARDGVLFETAYAQSHWTLPSHATMLTGLDPIAHGVMKVPDRLSEAHTTLAERLHEVGYWTGGWVGMRPYSYVGAKRNFAQGFELYLHRPHPRPLRSGMLVRTLDHVALKYLRGGVGNATAQIDSVERFLAARPPQPFFLFLHFYDVHSKFDALPYEAPEPFFDRFCPGAIEGFDGCYEGICGTHYLKGMMEGKVPMAGTQELDRIVCLYDGAVAYMDHELGRLFATLDRLGLAEDTVLVVTADHGEGFLEHGTTLHDGLYDVTTRVPLIIRAPDGARGRRVAGIGRLIDLVPTILELTGTPASGTSASGPLQGTSLAAVLRSGEGAPEDTFIVAGDTLALRRGDLKYFLNAELDQRPPGTPPEELYDVAADPGEQVNLAAGDLAVEDLERLAALRQDLGDRRTASRLIYQQSFDTDASDDFELPEDEIERLKALGYIN